MYPYNIFFGEKTDLLAQNKNLNKIWQPDINQKILEMIEMAIENETENKNYYEKLARKINNKTDAQILNQMSADAKKHCQYLKLIYKKIADREPKNFNSDDKILKFSDDLSDDFSNLMFRELDGIEIYQRLLNLFSDLKIRDMLCEIICCKQSNAIKLNYLYAKYNLAD